MAAAGQVPRFVMSGTRWSRWYGTIVHTVYVHGTGCVPHAVVLVRLTQFMTDAALVNVLSTQVSKSVVAVLVCRSDRGPVGCPGRPVRW